MDKKTISMKEDPELKKHWETEATKLGFKTFAGYLRYLLIRELGDGKFNVGRAVAVEVKA